jgi:hypothetical protein
MTEPAIQSALRNLKTVHDQDLYRSKADHAERRKVVSLFHVLCSHVIQDNFI